MSAPPPETDTIAAVATPPGRGGVGIVRISGPAAPELARRLTGKLPQPRRATVTDFLAADGKALDRGIALYFPAPHSFTGEHVLELQGHGGPVVMDLLLARCLELGARIARPGEFSERAFLNERLDLAQAEAVADLIDAGSREAAAAASRSLAGEFSQRVRALTDAVTELRVYVEAAIDFPEEEIDFLDEGNVLERVEALQTQLSELLEQARQGALLHEGMSVVIAGAPNVGKSSLLNKLAGYEAAIVTDIPGTTRDVLRERLAVDGLPLHVIDTAGLRESADPVEAEGVRRARAEAEKADRILLLIDDAAGETEADKAIRAGLPDIPLTLIRNKCDLTGNAPALNEGGSVVEVTLSAKTGDGLEFLREHLKQCMGYRQAEGGQFSARRRHLDALRRAGTALDRGHEQLVDHRAGELLAEELRLAQQALGEITGQVTSDDLLGEIFASFCIGK